MPPIQPEETLVGRMEETRVDPLVHGSGSGRWAKVAPLHARTYDAQDVVVSVVNAKKSRPPPLCEEERFLGLQYEVYFEHFLIHVGEKNFETDPKQSHKVHKKHHKHRS